MTIGQMRVVNSSPAKVLEHLKKEYGLYTYFKQGKLLCGLAYWPDKAVRHVFKFQHNIIQDNLEFIQEEDIKLKVKAVAIAQDNTKKEIQVGDPDGELRTLHFYDVSEKDLKTLAEQKLEELKYDGYKGTFVTFGEPMVDIGDIAIIKDEKFPDREGNYYIKSVEITFGKRGYRQKIELGPKVS